jgi:CTP synthase
MLRLSGVHSAAQQEPRPHVQVPLMMMEQKAHVTISNVLGLQGYNSIDMHRWQHHLADRWDAQTENCTIAVIGKYTNLADAYLSVIKALQHACLAARRKLRLLWVEAGDIEEEARYHAAMLSC